MILKLFSSTASSAHSLADSREVKRVIAELPAKDDLRSVNELSGWLESVANAEQFPLLALSEAVHQLDEAGQPFLRRLTRDYLGAHRRTPAEEKRMWTAAADYWQWAASAYETLLAEYAKALAARGKGTDQVKAALPLIYVRLIGALVAHRKWHHFHYEAAPLGLWKRIGAAYLAAQKNKAETTPVQHYPQLPGATTVVQEYVQAIALESSSLDALKPGEMELAEKLIGHFAPQFSLVQVNRPDNLYWIDAAEDRPPIRLARLPQPTPTVRLLGFGQAPEALASLVNEVERGDVPPGLALGGQYAARSVLKVLRHLASYWAPKPPLRQHQRHPVKSSLTVLRGFGACIKLYGGRRPDEDDTDLAFIPDATENWTVENASLGGFGASAQLRTSSAAIGDFLAMRPDGGDNWLLGLVRRYGRDAAGHALIGVETLCKQGVLLTLTTRADSSYVLAAAGTSAILLDPPLAVETVRVALPAATFDLKESYDSRLDDKSILLSPVELLESGNDYQIGRYRLRFAE